MKIILIIILSAMFPGNTADDPAVKPEELMSFTAKHWKGTLSYLDYGKNTEVSIPAELNVIQSESDLNVFYFSYEFPDEPQANGIDTIIVSKNGRKINNETVTENKYTNDSIYTFTTIKSGDDNNKKAEMKHTYILNGNILTIRKEVKYKDQKEFFVRNEFKFKR